MTRIHFIKLFIYLLFSLGAWGENCPSEVGLRQLQRGKTYYRQTSELRFAATLADPEVRPVSSIRQFTIATYNVLNLMQHVGKWVTDMKTGKRVPIDDGRPLKIDKPYRHIEGNAVAIKDMDPDILVLEEVESAKVLDDFNHRFLNDKYRALLIEGNDERGIDVGFLVKKDLPFDGVLSSYKDVPSQTEPGQPVFSRDLPVLELSYQGQALMAIAGTHFKSQRPGVFQGRPDRTSFHRRAEQVQIATEILSQYREKYHDQVPVMILGDFNNDVQSAPEFDVLKLSGFVDTFEDAKESLPRDQRVTHTYHPRDGPRDAKQMDGTFISRAFTRMGLILQSFVYRYKKANGEEKPIPLTFDERKENPSDHFPVFFRIDFQKLLSILKTRVVSTP